MYKYIIILVLFFSPLAAADNGGSSYDWWYPKTHDSIPKEFLGKWVTDLVNCNKWHPENLILAPKWVTYSEGEGAFVTGVSISKQHFSFIARQAIAESAWLMAVSLNLSKDGSKITDNNRFKNFKRVKCPLKQSKPNK